MYSSAQKKLFYSSSFISAVFIKVGILEKEAEVVKLTNDI